MYTFNAIVVAFCIATLFWFLWKFFIRPQLKFFRKIDEKHWLKEAEKNWQNYFSRYSARQQKELLEQYEESAKQIAEQVVLPYFERMSQTYGGAKFIQMDLWLWSDYNYRISSNLDPVLQTIDYPIPGLDCRGVWLKVYKLIEKAGLEGKCYYEYGDMSMDYYIQKNVA